MRWRTQTMHQESDPRHQANATGCEREGYVQEPGRPEASGQMYHHEGCGTMKYLRHRRQCGRNVGGERACESLRDPKHRRRGVIKKGAGQEISNALGGMQQKWKRGGYARKPGRPEASAQRYDWQGCGTGGTMRNLMHRGECSRIGSGEGTHESLADLKHWYRCIIRTSAGWEIPDA
jgi:hypothetical protein